MKTQSTVYFQQAVLDKNLADIAVAYEEWLEQVYGGSFIRKQGAHFHVF